jgi:hypothetical protein
MWALSTDGRRKRRENRMNEWMLTLFGRCLLFFSLSIFLFFSFALLHPIGRSYLSVLFSHLLRSYENQNGDAFFFSILFFVSSCLHLKAKNFLLLFFFIHIIYMRALKDDARFDLFLTLYCLYAWKKEIYIDDKSKNTKENIE